MPLPETEPLTASDDEIVAALAEAELPALLPSLAHLTGDRTLLDPALARRASAPQRAPGRAHARAAGARHGRRCSRCSPDGVTVGVRRRPRRRTTCCSSSWSSPSAAAPWRITCRFWRRSSASRRRTAGRRAGTRTTWRPTVDFTVAVIGAGMSGLLAAHRLAQAGVPSSCSRRTPTSAAPGARTPTRAAGSTSRTTSTATPSPRSTTGRSTSPPRRRCSTTSAAAPTSSTCAAHIRFGTEVALGTCTTTPRAVDARVRTADGSASSASRPTLSSARSVSSTARSSPTSPGCDTFAGPVVPLGPLGPRRRPRAASGWR